MDLCNNGNVLVIIRIIKIGIDILKILLPLILIVLIMIDFLKTIPSGKEEELSKSIKIAIRRIISALMIFIIPTIVEVISSNFKDGNTIFTCIANASKAGINNAYTSSARSYIATAKESLDIDSYELAVNQVNKIKNEDVRKELLSELDNISEAIDIRIEITNNYTPERYEEFKEKISSLDNDNYKTILLGLLDNNGNNSTEIIKLNVESGIKEVSYNGKKISKYYVIIPEDAMSNMPLIIFLHGDHQQDRVNNLTPFNYVKNGNAYSSGKFIFIAPVAKQNDWIIASEELKALIDNIVSEYKINKQKIIITGFSRGSIGTWNMVYKYPKFFSAAVPVSCSAEFDYKKDYSKFASTPVWAMEDTNVGDSSGCYHSSNHNDMEKLVKGIINSGGNAKFTLYDYTHSEMQEVYKNSELYSWMLVQTNKNVQLGDNEISSKTYTGPSYVEPDIAYSSKRLVTKEELNKLSCTLYHGYNGTSNSYYEPYDGEVWKFYFYKELIPQFLSIMDDVCHYVKTNNSINNIQIAGLGSGRSSNGISFHAAGLAFDLNSSFKYTSSNGKTYTPYNGQGANTWNNYQKFICEVCNGNENCEQNVNYQIYTRYFKNNGWCWGGNWGLDSFDPMHIEYRKDCYANNKMTISC